MVKIIENGFVVSGSAKNQIGCMTLIVQGNRILEIGRRADAVKVTICKCRDYRCSRKNYFPGIYQRALPW